MNHQNSEKPVERPSKYRRVKTPRVIQMEAVECGVASLSIILSYYGRYLPLEILRAECGVSRDGSNAFNLIKAGEKYGLQGEGRRADYTDLYELEGPVILFWQFRHFLVLEGFGRNEVFLNDPAIGPKTISYEELREGFSGIVLIFKKEPHFQAGGKPPSLLHQLSLRLRSVSSSLTYIWILSFCLLLPGFALPSFLMVFIGTFFTKNVLAWPVVFLIAVLTAILFATILTWVRQYYLNRLSTKLSIGFSSEFLWHLLQLPMEFYSQRYAGEIAYRMNLNDSVVKTFTGSILFSAIDLVLILFYGAVMFTYDPLLASVGILAGCINLGTMLLIYRSRVNAYARLQQDIAKCVGESIGGLQNIETIKARAGESDFFSKWAGYYASNINAYQNIGKKDVILTTIPPFFQMLALAILLGFGSYQVINSPLTVGMLMSLQLLMANFLLPINRFVGFGQMIQNMGVELDRLNDVLKNPIDVSYQPKKARSVDKVKLEGYLEFRNVTFGYARLSPPLIENFSFIVKPGQRLALVGPTGCGKSTVAKLASGLFHPWSGEIFYDDIPIEEIPRELLYNSIATVDQDIFLFAGTIRENLALWNSKVPDEMLTAAARDAAIHEEIIARSGGYDSLLLEGGRNLSGGQRQRIEIARSLLYNPSLLILDEATSALDSRTEMEISDKIKQRGCSAVMIAHRLSTIQDCDEIIVLDKGKIIQRGTHADLKVAEGLYRELILSEAPE